MSLFLHSLHIIYRYNFLNNSYSSFQLTTRAGHHTGHHRSLACMTVRVCHGTRVSRYARGVRRGVNMTLYCDYMLKLNNWFFFSFFFIYMSLSCLFLLFSLYIWRELQKSCVQTSSEALDSWWLVRRLTAELKILINFVGETKSVWSVRDGRYVNHSWCSRNLLFSVCCFSFPRCLKRSLLTVAFLL